MGFDEDFQKGIHGTQCLPVTQVYSPIILVSRYPLIPCNYKLRGDPYLEARWNTPRSPFLRLRVSRYRARYLAHGLRTFMILNDSNVTLVSLI